MKSLRARLTLRLLAGGALLLSGAGAALHWQIRQGLTAEFDEVLHTAAQSLATATELHDGRLKLDLPDEQMPDYGHDGGPEYLVLRDTDGREVQRSRSLGAGSLAEGSGIPKGHTVFDTTLPNGRTVRCFRLKFLPQMEEEDEGEHGTKNPVPIREATIVVARDRGPLDQQLAKLRTSLLLVGGGALAALALLVRWIVRDAMAPVSHFSETVAAVDARTLSSRISADPLPIELHPIAARLNELLSRLESAFTRERRFTATAAHELRTPLAELRSVAEVNLANPPNKAEATQSWRDILSATLRMESLSLALLDLARAENTDAVIHRKQVALWDAVTSAWQPNAMRAAERSLTFSVTIPSGLSVQTDPVFLCVILGNLCGNAAEHAPRSSSITVFAKRHNGTVTLAFRNPAGALSEEDLPHLFERFWRKDASRAESRHHGLGLALATEFTTILGGNLIARIEAGDVVFKLTLPDLPGL